MKKKRLGIIGAGSAGLLTLMHFCTWLDDSWEVYSIYNPKKQILGIGESTNGGFVGLLERATHFSFANPDDMKALDATIKYGSKFKNWRENSWVNPLLDGNTAIHFNNFGLKDFVFSRLEKLWPKQFRVLEGDVLKLSNRLDHVLITVLEDETGQERDHQFDYVVDCMGFPPDFGNYVISKCSPVNRCQIHSIMDYEYQPYTDHDATANGWMFGVPLQSRKTFGYMYNDTITSKEEAQADMKRLLGVEMLDDKEYIFNSYYTRSLIEGRICKNGNKALFFEPLVANSIFVYIYTAQLFYDFIMGTSDAAKTNAMFTKAVQQMEDVISYYYQGGSTFDSPFWDFAAPYTKQRLDQRREFEAIMTTYRTLKDRGILYTAPEYGFSPLTWEIVDEQMGYAYIGR